jgi:hypothetical protein
MQATLHSGQGQAQPCSCRHDISHDAQLTCPSLLSCRGEGKEQLLTLSELPNNQEVGSEMEPVSAQGQQFVSSLYVAVASSPHYAHNSTSILFFPILAGSNNIVYPQVKTLCFQVYMSRSKV